MVCQRNTTTEPHLFLTALDFRTRDIISTQDISRFIHNISYARECRVHENCPPTPWFLFILPIVGKNWNSRRLSGLEGAST